MVGMEGLNKLNKISFFTVLGSTKTHNATVSLTIELTGQIRGNHLILLDFPCTNRRFVYEEK